MDIPRAFEHFAAAERRIPHADTVFHLHRGRAQAAMHGLRTEVLARASEQVEHLAAVSSRPDLSIFGAWGRAWAAADHGQLAQAFDDDQIGRLLAFLDEYGWRENTLVILVSDNGESGEGGPNGSANEMKFVHGIPDTVEASRADRRFRQPEDVQPLSERLGDGVQHAVQDVEALRVQRRHERSVHRLLARGHEGEG